MRLVMCLGGMPLWRSVSHYCRRRDTFDDEHARQEGWRKLLGTYGGVFVDVRTGREGGYMLVHMLARKLRYSFQDVRCEATLFVARKQVRSSICPIVSCVCTSELTSVGTELNLDLIYTDIPCSYTHYK